MMSGNVGVGIGNVQPILQKLAVRGDITNDENREISVGAAFPVITANQRVGALTFYSNNNSLETAAIECSIDPSSLYDSRAYLRFYTRNDYGSGAQYAERMRIDPFGNVGIGTITPRANLDVNGNIYAACVS